MQKPTEGAWPFASIDTSVVVPCYDAADTVGELLDSLANQVDVLPWELVIADNGSTDDTLDVVRSYRDRIPHVTFVDARDRSGASYARNQGVRHARGEYLVFVDADDVVEPTWLSALRASIPRDGLAASRFEANVINDPDMLRTRSCPQQDGLMSFGYSDFLPFASSSGLAMRRETFIALDGFDVSLVNGEDIDLCWRAQLEGRSLVFADDAVLHYRLRGDPAEVARQMKGYGYWTVPLVDRYRKFGMPRVPLRNGLKAWAKLLVRLPGSLRSTDARAKWWVDFAYRWGLLRGSIAYRTLVL